MIEKITLENFKGIGKETTVRLAQLTLLFGANSAGKSTILHALAYAREIFERHNCNADKTILGGDSLDLGEFTEIVHKHNPQGIVRMKFDFAFVQRRIMKANRLPYTPEKGWIKIEVGVPRYHKKFQDTRNYPCALFMQVGIDGKPLVELEYCSSDTVRGGYQGRVRRLNVDHPAIEDEREAYESLFPFHEQLAFREGESDEDKLSNNEPNLNVLDYHYLRGRHALPEKSRIPPLQLRNGYQLKRPGGGFIPTPGTLNLLISRAITELLDLLTRMVYVGPIREIPARNFSPQRTEEVSRWAKGLGAYDVLPALEKEWEQINNDLSKTGDEYLDTGYELVYIPRNYEFDGSGKIDLSKHYFPTKTKTYIENLELDDYKQNFPRDEWFGLFDIKRKVLVQMHNVGVGLSQIIPLVVCMAKNKGQTLMFEQPELHLHPKQQAAVGDLLIRAAQSGTQIIAETHSIHLILRVLRRINETFRTQTKTAESFTRDDLKVLFARSVEGTTDILEVAVGKDGEFLDGWPDENFFEQELKERLAIC